ncbi:MAG: aquaporin, partial [Cyanobacteria bacterium J06635_11]
MTLLKKCLAEGVGTAWLVLGGCGSAVLAATFTGAELGNGISFPLGLGFVGVSLAFGLTVLTMAYAIGHISGCHLNPAVSFGLWAGGRFPSGELLPYIISQVLGAIVGIGILYLIATGQEGFAVADATWAANGFGELSPGNFSLGSCFIAEVVMT